MNTIIPLVDEEMNPNLDPTVNRFVKKFHIGKLLKKCGAVKMAGISVLVVFLYIFNLVFRGRSMYMDQRLGRSEDDPSKNTVYRLLEDPKINWERFGRTLAAEAIRELEPLTSDDRINAFVVDDSIYTRDRGKKFELMARVYDHNDHRHHLGYRYLVLGWTDGNTFLPIQSCLLSSGSDDNVVGPIAEYDKRTLAYKRRERARQKATDVTVELIGEAIRAGVKADVGLFDSWFFSPKMAIRLMNEYSLPIISMAKKTSKVKYRVGEGDEAQMLDVKEIYAQNRKRPGRSRYLLSVPVRLGEDANALPARLVFIRNRNKRKDWLVLITTDMSLSEEEIIRIYGKRWSIETYFKVCKQYMRLTNEFHMLSYDALNAHVVIVQARYIMLAMEQRCQTDFRTLGDLFMLTMDELQDITFIEALTSLLTLISSQLATQETEGAAELETMLERFIETLPECLRRVFVSAQKRCA